MQLNNLHAPRNDGAHHGHLTFELLRRKHLPATKPQSEHHRQPQSNHRRRQVKPCITIEARHCEAKPKQNTLTKQNVDPASPWQTPVAGTIPLRTFPLYHNPSKHNSLHTADCFGATHLYSSTTSAHLAMTVLTTAVMLASCFEGSPRQLQKPNRNTTANYTATIGAPSLRGEADEK